MRRTPLGGHENFLVREVSPCGGFWLSLILRKVLGAGTPRQKRGSRGLVSLQLVHNTPAKKIEIGPPEAESQYLVRNRSSNHEARLAARRGWSCRKLLTYAPGCYGLGICW